MKIYHFLKDKYAKQAINNKRLKVSLFNQLNDPFELSCFNLRNHYLRDAHKVYKEGIVKKYGMIAFSKDYKNPLMWGHYADKHMGVCLGFESMEDDLVEVRYRAERIKIENKTFATEKDVEDLLSIKFKDWSYEKEMRLLVKLKDAVNEDGFYFEPFTKALKLVEVNLGFQCQSTLRDYDILLKSVGFDKVHLRKLNLAVSRFGVTKTIHVTAKVI